MFCQPSIIAIVLQNATCLFLSRNERQSRRTHLSRISYVITPQQLAIMLGNAKKIQQMCDPATLARVQATISTDAATRPTHANGLPLKYDKYGVPEYASNPGLSGVLTPEVINPHIPYMYIGPYKRANNNANLIKADLRTFSAHSAPTIVRLCEATRKTALMSRWGCTTPTSQDATGGDGSDAYGGGESSATARNPKKRAAAVAFFGGNDGEKGRPNLEYELSDDHAAVLEMGRLFDAKILATAIARAEEMENTPARIEATFNPVVRKNNQSDVPRLRTKVQRTPTKEDKTVRVYRVPDRPDAYAEGGKIAVVQEDDFHALEAHFLVVVPLVQLSMAWLTGSGIGGCMQTEEVFVLSSGGKSAADLSSTLGVDVVVLAKASAVDTTTPRVGICDTCPATATNAFPDFYDDAA